MAKGLKLPIQVTPQGRTALLEGDEQLRKIIALNLSWLENGNPFQQWRGVTHNEPGIDPAIVFSVNSTFLSNKVARNIKSLFHRFQAAGRASLVEGYPKMTRDSANQELIADIKYINLETDKVDEFSHRFTLRSQP